MFFFFLLFWLGDFHYSIFHITYVFFCIPWSTGNSIEGIFSFQLLSPSVLFFFFNVFSNSLLKFSLCSSRLCFFLIFVFNWRIIALQCHAGFCCLCRKLSETVTCLGAPSCRTVPIVFTCVPSGRAESDVSMSPVFSLAVLTAINLVGGGGAKARARPELGLLCTVASITLFGPGVSLKLLEQKPPGPL